MKAVTVALCFLVNFFSYSKELYWEINNEAGIDIREFHKEEAHANQKNTYSSFIRSEIFIEIENQGFCMYGEKK